MLREISIKNIALIDELSLPLGDGLNVLTGETGAGKSILIESINFALGKRMKKSLLRTGEKSGFVELLFITDSKYIENILDELGIPCESDGTLLISRTITESGKSSSRINGRTVTLSMLKKITSVLIDIHGQHEHQSILNPSSHSALLDSFGKEDFLRLLDTQRKKWSEYKKIEKELEILNVDDRIRQRNFDLYKYQLDEINSADLKIGEEEELLSKQKKLRNSEKIVKTLSEMEYVINGSDDEFPSIIDGIEKIKELSFSLSGIDESIDKIIERLNGLSIELEDISYEIREYGENLEHDEATLEIVESRINTLYTLKRKYGETIEEILEYRDKIEKEVLLIEDSDEKLEELKEELSKIKKEMEVLSSRLSKKRKDMAKIVGKNIESILKELAMPNVKFSIDISKREEFNKNGIDNVEFLIAPNSGEPLKPLSHIASGGEMSRTMLALKSVLADVDKIETLIFDEIDTGVSGRTAQKVSELLAKIGFRRQVICVTHLPQLAAMGDNHFKIEKVEKKGRTFTTVGPLPENESLAEIARLLSGAKETETSLANATELKNEAIKLKKKLGKALITD